LLFARTTLFLGCWLSLIAPSVFAQSDSAQPADSGDEYSGPAILSRGETPGGQTQEPVAFRPYVGLNAIYDTGLVPVSVTSTGTIPSSDLYGVELNMGAYTYRNWKHTTLALDYRGDFRHYPNATYWDGTDQFLALILTHRPSKRVTFTLREDGGLYSRNYFLSSTLGALDPNYLLLPQSDIFDNRVIFLGTSADLTYHKSARLSFNFGGQGSVVRRQSSALYGVTSGVARADVEYRATRHSTLGVDYRFTYFQYTRGFGDTQIHSVGLNYSTRLSPHVQFSTRAGGARVASSSLAVVPLDPAVAALLGVSTGIQATYQMNYLPDVQARLADSFRRSELAVQYMNSVVPGNGVFVSSRNNMGVGSYSYSGIRHWNFGVDGSYGRMSSLGQNFGPYTSYGGGAGFTRDLGKGLHSVLRFDTRHYDISSSSMFKHTEYRVTLGLTFAPGDIPLVLW
jgi:hypothetical protein